MEKKDTKDNKEKNKDDRVWLGGSGIIYVEVADRLNQESVFEFLEKIVEILRTFPVRGKLLVHINQSTNFTTPSLWRKEMANKAIAASKELDFEKIAVYGGSVMARTIGSFILAAAIGIKNVKLFKTEKEALRWLKEP